MNIDEFKILLADVVIAERDLRLANAELMREVERLKQFEPKEPGHDDKVP